MDTVPPAPVPNFQVLRVLDQDSAAVTCLAVDASRGQSVLVVGHHPVTDPGQQASYMNWAARLATVTAGQHHLANVTGHGLAADLRPYLAVRAGTQTLATRLRGGGALPPDQVQRIGVALANALAALHVAGMVHGVVRPATVLLDNPEMPQLAGFDGVAPHLGAPAMPSAFTPPELLGAPGTSSPASDVYDLAMTLYAALGGRVPWASDDGSGVTDVGLRGLPLAAVPGVSDSFIAVLQAAMAVDPGQRPTAAALAAALSAVPAPAATGPFPTDRAVPVAVALLVGAGARPVIDAVTSGGVGAGMAATATHAGAGIGAPGYQVEDATSPMAGSVPVPVASGLGGGAPSPTSAMGSGAPTAAGGITAAKVVVIAVIAAVIGGGAVVAYNALTPDPPSRRAVADAPTPTPSSASAPTSTPPTSASPSPSGPDGTVRGAAQSLEEYLHAMGNGDVAGACKYAAYHFLREYGGTYDSAFN